MNGKRYFGLHGIWQILFVDLVGLVFSLDFGLDIRDSGSANCNLTSRYNGKWIRYFYTGAFDNEPWIHCGVRTQV